MRTYKLVVVSNRLPVSVSKRDGKLHFEASSGGLATAMSTLDQADRIWVGWPGIASDDLSAQDKREITTELGKHGCYPVYLTKQQVELFYEGYSNDVLWPLFHYFQSLTRHKEEYWHAYNEVNKIFGAAVQKVASSTGSIWVHDYQLMMLPGIIRQSLPRTSIGFFLHIPFPSFEIYRLLPQRKELLEGLLGADLIGFHIFDYARHFLSSCLRLLGVNNQQGVLEYQGRTIKTDAYPIGIDYQKFRAALNETATKKALGSLENSYKGMKVIISVDRLDYSKGIPQRLESFRTFLEMYPKWRGKVKLIMLAVPSRTEVGTYQQLRETIEQAVSRINGEYGTVDWSPISYQFQNRPLHEVIALYAAADVALVTPIRDGMNLVAKEYVASKQNRSGVLILSEMAGAIDELPEAISINPLNTRSVAEAMNEALNMSKREQQRRIRDMQRRLRTYTVQTWALEFLTDLELAAGGRGKHHRKEMTSEHRAEVLDSYAAANSRLIILDYDGTLRDFVSSPRSLLAKPPIRLRRLIKRLAEDEHTHLAIVSGRPKKALEKWFRGIDATLVAEHGAWTKYEGKWSRIESDFTTAKKQVKPILERFVARTAGAELEEKDYSLVWHYRNVVPELAYVRANELKRELTQVIEDDDIGVYNGDKIIEIKPVGISKGSATAELESMYEPDFILVAGDDYTDEDMFRDLAHRAVTVKVGPGHTRARYRLNTVAEMNRLLDDLSQQNI